MSGDPRLTPARPDLAAEHLRESVTAARYVAGQPGVVLAEVLDMRDMPDLSAALSTQLLWGEPVTIYEPRRSDGFAWVQSDVDGYVGYVQADQLRARASAPSHLVTAQSAQLYVEPALKRPPVANLPGNARIQVSGVTEGYAQVGEFWCPLRHLTLLNDRAGDFVSIAERYLGLPYLWGGRSTRGLDCSALVQLALGAVGKDVPRDSDMQDSLGHGVEVADQRGDLVFWNGHVAIMLDGTRMIHANAHHMAVVIEPLAEAVARIGESDTGPVTHIRRLAESKSVSH